MKTNQPFPSTRTHWATTLLVAAAVTLQFSAIDLFGGTKSQPCVLFDDLPGDSVQSDVGDGHSPYCNARFSNDGHLEFDSNLFIGFGRQITVKDPNNPTIVLAVFQTTDQLEAAGITHSAKLMVASHQSNFNMLTMALDEVRTDVNLMISLFLKFPDRRQAVPIYIKLAPEVVDSIGPGDQCNDSNPVMVTCISAAAGKANGWRVDTQDPDNKACVSQNVIGHFCNELTIGCLNLSFGFIVTK